MHGICDSCEESADSLLDLTRLPEFKEIVSRLNYRKVCESCYDDLFEEVKQQQEQASDRRGDKRYKLRLAVNISGEDREGRKFSEQTFTEDVSTSGIRISTQQDLETGSVLTLSIPDVGFEAAVLVELVWKDEDKMSAGLKLTETNETWNKMIAERSITLQQS